MACTTERLVLHLAIAPLGPLVGTDALHGGSTLQIIPRLRHRDGPPVYGLTALTTLVLPRLQRDLDLLPEGLHLPPVAVGIVVGAHAVEWLTSELGSLVELLQELLPCFWRLRFVNFKLLEHELILVAQLHLPVQVL